MCLLKTKQKLQTDQLCFPKKVCNFFFKKLYRRMVHEPQADSTILKNHYSHQLPEENAPSVCSVYNLYPKSQSNHAKNTISHISKPQCKHAFEN